MAWQGGRDCLTLNFTPPLEGEAQVPGGGGGAMPGGGGRAMFTTAEGPLGGRLK